MDVAHKRRHRDNKDTTPTHAHKGWRKMWMWLWTAVEWGDAQRRRAAGTVEEEAYGRGRLGKKAEGR